MLYITFYFKNFLDFSFCGFEFTFQNPVIEFYSNGHLLGIFFSLQNFSKTSSFLVFRLSNLELWILNFQS